MTADVIGIGENSLDLVVRIPLPPASDGKQPISSRRLSPGGQVATTMCTCAALGLRTAYIGAFGDDDHGRIVREAMQSRGVDLSAAAIRQAPNRYAVILVDDRTGSRSVFFQRDPALALRRGDLSRTLIADTRVVHLDGTDPEAALEAAAIAGATGRIVTVDIDDSDDSARALIAAATHPIVAAHVPAAITGESDIEKALRAMRRLHQPMVCVTLGDRGSAMLAGDTFHHVPAPKVAAVDTTGAGDVFRGAFIYALLRGDDPAAILSFANAAAAISCTREGAIESVPFHGELQG